MSSSSTRCWPGTSFDVLAEFFPNFSQLDKFDHLGALGKMPTTIICGTKDKLTSDRTQPEDGRSASRTPYWSSARAPDTWSSSRRETR